MADTSWGDGKASFLISQMEQSWYDIRDHRTRFWQILLASALANSAILAVGIHLDAYLPRIGLILVSLVLSAVFIVQAYKERFFELSRTLYVEQIQSELATQFGARVVLFRTKDILSARRAARPSPRDYNLKDMPHSALFGFSAWSWLALALWAIPSVTLVVLVAA